MRLSRNMLHGWKDNSVLAKPLAACTHLSSTVSQLFELQLQKIAVFTSAAHIFVSPGDTPAIITQYVASMERQFNACQTPGSMYPSFFNSFPVIRTVNDKSPLSMRKSKNCYFYHIFVSPGDAPGSSATPFGTEKLEWHRYRRVKKFRRYLYSFWRNSQT